MSYDFILVNGDSYSAPLSFPVWPEHLGQLLNKPVENYAFSGANNKRILRSTIEYCLQAKQRNQTPLVILGWSFIRRKEVWYYGDAPLIEYMIPDRNQNPLTQLITLDALINSNLATVEQKYMIEDAHNVHKILVDFWTDIYLLSNVLKSHGIPYWFFSAAKNTDCPVDCFPYIANLHLVKDCLKDKNIWKINEFCVQGWAKENDNSADKVTGHLSDQGHIKFAKFIQEKIKDIC